MARVCGVEIALIMEVVSFLSVTARGRFCSQREYINPSGGLLRVD
jgi:hypothetical protein